MIRNRPVFRPRSIRPDTDRIPDRQPESSPRFERTVSPIYPSNPSYNREKTEKNSGDRLKDLLKDRRYHSVEEMERLFPNGGWVKGMRELLTKNYAFDRSKDFFKLRMRGSIEPRQVLARLIVGIQLRQVQKVLVENAITTFNPDEIHKDDFNPMVDPSGDNSEKEDLTNGLILSDPADALILPAATSITMASAILAKRNSGKTYLAMVLAEEMMSSKLSIPVVILDPTGCWYGLRSWADGMPSSFKILVLGGQHGDLSFTAKDGAKIATIVHQARPHTVVLDLSHLAPFEQHEFVAIFGEEFYAKAEREPIHIIVDEADEFAPQQINKGSRYHKRSLDAMDRWARRGRNKGMGLTLITQRSAVISKNLLSQVDAMWLLNMVAPMDLRALDDWLAHTVTSVQRSECLSQISRLPPGVAFFLQGGSFPKFRRFKVRRKKTFDSSRTPTGGSKVAPVFSRPVEAVVQMAKAILMGEVAGDKDRDKDRAAKDSEER